MTTLMTNVGTNETITVIDGDRRGTVKVSSLQEKERVSVSSRISKKDPNNEGGKSLGRMSDKVYQECIRVAFVNVQYPPKVNVINQTQGGYQGYIDTLISKGYSYSDAKAMASDMGIVPPGNKNTHETLNANSGTMDKITPNDRDAFIDMLKKGNVQDTKRGKFFTGTLEAYDALTEMGVKVYTSPANETNVTDDSLINKTSISITPQFSAFFALLPGYKMAETGFYTMTLAELRKYIQHGAIEKTGCIVARTNKYGGTRAYFELNA